MSDSDSAEEKLYAFYAGRGWNTEAGVTEDARRFEDLRDVARDYLTRCRRRVQRHVPERGANLLDMASGPIQYDEYLEYSRNFERRYCVDLSPQALEAAQRKIGEHGVFLCGNWLEIPLAADLFDCTVSLHTIYHIDKDEQERAVRKLLHVTRPGKPVIIVYSNPRPLPSMVRGTLRRLRLLPARRPTTERSFLYVHAHPLSWWRRFEDVAEVEVSIWRSLATRDQKAMIPNNVLGRRMLDGLFYLEDVLPAAFARLFQYPMIILRKRA